MKTIRQILLATCLMIAFVVAAEEPDPVITSIRNAYQQAKESIKKDKGMGNELVTTSNYNMHRKGKTTETLHFFFNTIQGTYLLADGDESDPHFCYYPLYFVTRSYNIGKQKYYEEYLFDPSSQRLLFVLNQDYDENGKRFDRRLYYHNGALYRVDGPTSSMDDFIVYQAEEFRHAFDWLMRNPKE